MEKSLMNMQKWISRSHHLIFMISILLLSSHSLSKKLDSTLIIRGEGSSFTEVLNGITQDLEGEIEFTILMINSQTSTDQIAQKIQQSSPKAIVLMGNKAINLYQKYQQNSPDQQFPPSILLVALYIDQHVKNIKNSTGILYEIPAVTALVNLRKIMSNDIKYVGVIHREWMKEYVDTNIQYCHTEGIKLITAEIGNNEKNPEKLIKKHLKLFKKRNIDALWIINDSQLLTPRLFSKAWLPSLKKMKIPVIVGVESLLSSKLNFGTFAVIPDHYSLGVQGASILADLMDADWALTDQTIEPAISVTKIINMTISNKKDLSIIDENLEGIDKIIN